MRTTDAYNVPLGGLDLSKGYTGDQFFRFGEYAGDDWLLNGVYAANPSLQPFISVASHPLHLHGYRTSARDGGHIVSVQVAAASVTVWLLDDLVLRIHDVARALMPMKTGEVSRQSSTRFCRNCCCSACSGGLRLLPQA